MPWISQQGLVRKVLFALDPKMQRVGRSELARAQAVGVDGCSFPDLTDSRQPPHCTPCPRFNPYKHTNHTGSSVSGLNPFKHIEPLLHVGSKCHNPETTHTHRKEKSQQPDNGSPRLPNHPPSPGSSAATSKWMSGSRKTDGDQEIDPDEAAAPAVYFADRLLHPPRHSLLP